MIKYLINSVMTYRVETVEDAKALQVSLNKLPHCSLNSFSYTTKFIKEKGEVIGEYQLVKAKLIFNEEKDPVADVKLYFDTADTASMDIEGDR